MTEVLPRRFGSYVLTAFLGEDAVGRVYRALRIADHGFVRLRLLESPEISEDAVLDAIQENGEIHAFLKNPAIARGVQMDSVEGVPFLAWDEANGRTLDALVARAPRLQGRIPLEHSLLIAEKIATALDHAYNTNVEGERTLHGFVWPGFVSLSDDGETTLSGFGLAPGLLVSRSRPRFAREIAPYLAPEVRAEGKIAKNSDVYSVGAILFELLVGRLPAPGGPVADLFAVARGPSPLPPEITAVVKMCLSEAGGRYQSSGELRRELGKLLFSGPYSPSTFNLAYFLNNVFAAEIEAETRARDKEAGIDVAAVAPEPAAPSPSKPPAAAPPASRPAAPGRAAPPPSPPSGPKPTTSPKFLAPPEPRRKIPAAAIGGALLAAAVAGTWFVIARKPAAPSPAPTPRPTAVPVPTATPEPAPSTTGMSAAQFKEEVARRVSEEMKKMEDESKRQQEAAATARRAELTATAAAIAAFTPTPEPSPVQVAQAPEPTRPPPPPTATPEPVHESPPTIARIVKPVYPPVALQARIGGLIILRVLVSESGQPLEVEVVRGGAAGLTEAAVAAVRKWTFVPAKKGTTPVKAWTTVPIPFEP